MQSHTGVEAARCLLAPDQGRVFSKVSCNSHPLGPPTDLSPDPWLTREQKGFLLSS